MVLKTDKSRIFLRDRVFSLSFGRCVRFVFFKYAVSNQAETPGSESESNLMDYGLFDLHTGLPQRNYSRGEAKVNFAIYLACTCNT